MAKLHSRSTKEKITVSRRNLILFLSGLVAVILVVIIVFLLTLPERSVASFCRVAKKSILVMNGGNYEQRLDAYKKLEIVSPEDIRSDITIIRKGYESIIQSPSNSIAAGLGMSGAENQRTDYITKHCTDF